MALQYQNKIEQALREFDGSYSDNVYEAYAWSGLMGNGEFDENTYLYENSTVAWENNTTQQERVDILSVIGNFRNSHSTCSD